MNSADQGVFPMDTAFKRRWDFKYFSINHDEDLIDDTHFIINDETIYWNDLRKQINDELLSYNINEDKLIGPFFAFNEYHNKEIPIQTFKDIFKNKIIMYLFEDAAKAKNAIIASQQKEIANLYNDWANDIADRAKFYSHKTNASATLSERYYKELYNQMKATSKMVSDEVAGLIKSNMYTIADSVVTDNVKWLQSFGFSPDGLNAAFSYVPHDVVQMLITGQVYQGGWNLSQRIWSDSQQTQKDVYQIMARGLAENKSIYSIAKDLESYVRPGAKKSWNPILAMKNTKTGEIEYKRIYKKQKSHNYDHQKYAANNFPIKTFLFHYLLHLCIYQFINISLHKCHCNDIYRQNRKHNSCDDVERFAAPQFDACFLCFFLKLSMDFNICHDGC